MCLSCTAYCPISGAVNMSPRLRRILRCTADFVYRSPLPRMASLLSCNTRPWENSSEDTATPRSADTESGAGFTGMPSSMKL